MRTHSFSGLGAAGIQAVGWARQREVAGFHTGPATVLGPRDALLPAERAAVCAAALGLGDDRVQELTQLAGSNKVLGEGQEKVLLGMGGEGLPGLTKGIDVGGKWQRSVKVRHAHEGQTDWVPFPRAHPLALTQAPHQQAAPSQ